MKSIINFSFNLLQIIFIYFFYLITRPIKYFLTKNNVAIVENLTPKPSLIKKDADPTDNPLVEKRTLGELGVYSDPNLANGSKPKQKSFKKEPIASPNTKPPTEMKKKILQENLDQLNKSLLQAASSLSGDSGITMEQLDSLVKTYLASKQLIERPNGNSIPVPSAESLLSTQSSREVIENYTAGHDDLPKDSSVESITQSNEYVQKIFSSGDQVKSGPVLPEALLEKLATDIISKVDNHLDSKFQKMEERYSNEHSELVKCVSTSLSTIKTGQEQNIKLQSQMTDFHKALNEIKQKQMETESLIRNKVCEDNSAKEISREVPTQTSYPETRDIGIVTHAMTKKENDEAESIEISNLKEDIESFTNHIVRQDREKAELKACIEQLKVANKEANLSLLALKSQTTQRERLNSVNEDDRRELENVITQQKQRLSNLIQEKTEMATSFENEKIKIGNESALKELAFKEEIASLMRDSENITNELNNARLEMESLKKSNDAVNALIETLESESNEKSIKIASLSDQLDSVTDLLKNKEQEIREKYSKFNERLLNDEILALKGELHDKKSEISRLNALCRSFNSDLDTKQHLLDKRTASFDQKYDRLERHLSNTNNDLVRVRNEKLNLIEQRDNLKNRLEESQTELTTIKSKHSCDASETSCDKVDSKSLPESLVESDNHQNEDHESAPQATLPSTVKTETTSNQSFVTKSAEIAVIDHVNDLTADASETSCDEVDHKSSTESLVESDGRQNEDYESVPDATLPSSVKTQITSNRSFVTRFKSSMSILTGGLSWFIGSGKELPNTPDQPKSCDDTTNGSNMKTTGPSTTMSSVNDGVEPYFEPHSKDDALDKNLRAGTSDDEDEFHDSVEKLQLKSSPNVCEKVSINTGPDAIMDPEQPKCMGVDITNIPVPKASCSQDQMIVGNQHVVDKTKSCGQQSNVDLLGDTNDDPRADKLMVSEDDIEECNTTGTNIILATDDATTGELSSSESISTLKGIKKIPTIDTHHEQTSQKVEAVGNPKNIEIMAAPNDNEAMEVKRAASMDANTENGTNLTDNYEGSHMKNKKVSFASGTKLDSSDEEEEESLDEEEVEDGEDGEDREINNDGEDREINNDAEDGEINNDADGKADIIFQNKLRLGLGRIASRYAHENIVADTEPDSGSTEVAPSAEIAETSDGETTDNSLVERYMCTGEGVREVPCGETSPDEEVSNGDGDFIARYINDDTSINVSPEVSPVIKEKESSLQSAAEDNREGDSAAVGELDSGDVKIDQPNRREQLVALQHQIMRGLWSLEQERVREREQQDCDDQDDDIKEGEVTSSPAPLDMIQEEGQE